MFPFSSCSSAPTRRPRPPPASQTPAFALPSLTPMALTALASLIETATRKRDRSSFTPRGSLVALRTDGAHLHVVYDASGPADASAQPCVVLEAGSNSWSAMWDDVASELSRVTRVLRYDRFGYGHSDDLFNNTVTTTSTHVYSHHPTSPPTTATTTGGYLRTPAETQRPQCPFNWLRVPNRHYSSPDHNIPPSNYRFSPTSSSPYKEQQQQQLHQSRHRRKLNTDLTTIPHVYRPPVPRDRDPRAVASDLCEMLARVGAHPPYIFVAHSLGALYINEAIRQLGEDDVCGVVYIDPASRRTVRLLSNVVPSSTIPNWLASILSATGFSRSLAPLLLGSYWKAFSPSLRLEAKATWARAAWLRAYTAEWAGAVRYAFERIANSVATPHPGSNACSRESDDDDEYGKRLSNKDLIDFDDEDIEWLGNRPLAVLVPDIYKRTRGREFVEALQEKAARASRDSVVYRVKDCGHFVQLDRPDAVVDAVTDVMERARQKGFIK